MAIIQASIPFFFLLIGIELVVSRRRREPLMRLNDSVSDLSLGILSELTGLFVKVASVGIYALVVKHWAAQRFLPLPSWNAGAPVVRAEGLPGFAVDGAALASWAAVFLLVDFAYYWLHRYSHVVNVLWAGHVVHHSSEEYNLTVALRQSSLHGLLSWIFYIPLALIGIPVEMFVAAYALNLVYQFWIHTRAVNRLWAPVEWVMNTPSHHRVHHGINPRYLDRNYAGVFIVWDRLFGTFEPETEEVVYGITKPLASWNPVWANVHVFVDIARGLRAARSWKDRAHVVFGPPGSEGAVIAAAEAVPVPAAMSPSTGTAADGERPKFDPAVPRPLAWYALAQFTAVLAGSVKILEAAPSLVLHEKAALVFYVGLALTNVGGIFEGRRWAGPMEAARLLTGAATFVALGAAGLAAPLLAATGAAFALGSLLWLRTLRPLLVNDAEEHAHDAPLAPAS